MDKQAIPSIPGLTRSILLGAALAAALAVAPGAASANMGD